MPPERRTFDASSSKVECNECGEWFRSLAKHRVQVHSARCVVRYLNDISVEIPRNKEDGFFYCQFCKHPCSTVTMMAKHAKQCDGTSKKQKPQEQPWVPWRGKVLGEDNVEDEHEDDTTSNTPAKNKSQKKHHSSSSGPSHSTSTPVKVEKGSGSHSTTVKQEKKRSRSRPAPVSAFLDGLRRPLGQFSDLFSELGFDDMDDIDVLRHMPDEWELLGDDLKSGGMKLLEWMVVKEGLKKRFLEHS